MAKEDITYGFVCEECDNFIPFGEHHDCEDIEEFAQQWIENRYPEGMFSWNAIDVLKFAEDYSNHVLKIKGLI